MRQQGLSFIQKLIRFLGTRNVRLQSRGLPKGMGQTRKGTIKKVSGARGWTDPMSIPRASQVMGGGRLFTPIAGGKSKFITKGSTYGHTRGAKIGATGAAGGAVLTAAGLYEKKQTPSGVASTGADSAGKRQFTAVTALKGLRTKPTKGGPQLRKRSEQFNTRTITQGGKVISAEKYKALPFAKDIVKMSKSGYHKYRKGSAGAKSFQAAHKAAKGKQFRWKEGTGKLYSGA